MIGLMLKKVIRKQGRANSLNKADSTTPDLFFKSAERSEREGDREKTWRLRCVRLAAKSARTFEDMAVRPETLHFAPGKNAQVIAIRGLGGAGEEIHGK